MKTVYLAFICVWLFATGVFAVEQTGNPADTPVTGTFSSIKSTQDIRPLPPIIKVNESYRWKDSNRYEQKISDDYKGSYGSGEEISFFIEGQADLLKMNNENGFEVNVLLYDVTQKSGKYADVAYDAEKSAWKTTFVAPADRSKEYKIGVTLFCKKTVSPCADVYGAGTQRNLMLHLQVF